jgi:hypothetical protein
MLLLFFGFALQLAGNFIFYWLNGTRRITNPPQDPCRIVKPDKRGCFFLLFVSSFRIRTSTFLYLYEIDKFVVFMAGSCLASVELLKVFSLLDLVKDSLKHAKATT